MYDDDFDIYDDNDGYDIENAKRENRVMTIYRVNHRGLHDHTTFDP